MQITQCQPQYNSNKINVVIPSQTDGFGNLAVKPNAPIVEQL